MLSACLFALALPALPMRPGLEPETLVLTYHDMVPVRDSKVLWFDCTPQELEDQLDGLAAQGASFVDVHALHRHLTRGEPLSPNPVLVTFADNYLGFYTHALPILRRRRIPSVMFVHTDHVGGKTGRPKMDWRQLKELDREGLVTIASQTRSHPKDLRTLSDAHLQAEFAGSKHALQEKLGHRVPYLAYPNGKFDRRVANAAKAAGYEMAFTEEQEPAEASGDIFQVPRYVHTKFREGWADARR